jgi:hypothetical protein
MMRMTLKSFVLLGAMLPSLALWAADKSVSPAVQALLKSDTVIWAGLDYSLVRMYGTQDFQQPENIFPQMLNTWNSLFLTELVFHKSERLQQATGKTVKAEIEGITARNQLAKADQVIRQDGVYCGATHIQDADIAAAIRSYPLTSTSGLGLVFIVDRLVKAEQKGAVYLVYFDVAKREVVSQQRVIVKAGGFGFRNYWFRVVKDALPELKKLR